jgi:oligopeptide/dipeptide ABC transporter ATP-binding protein
MSGGLALRDVLVVYPRGGPNREPLAAVDGVSLVVAAGEILGLVGESGCGKSTLGRAILGLVPLAGGSIRWQGRRIDDLPRRAFRAIRGELQLVFQDPAACLDPRMTIAESVAEPLRSLAPRLAPTARADRVRQILDEVGLSPDVRGRYPHQASGGQLQRAVIARALVVDPRLVVCDEPVSALDVSIQGQIVNLIARIRRDRGLACLFISHNLAVVASLAERVLVMYRGRIVESGACRALLDAPLHPYTRLLVDSVPDANPERARRLLARRAAPAMRDTAIASPGCPFVARCSWAVDRCRTLTPPLRDFGQGRQAACHRADEWRDGLPPDRAADRLTR